MLEPINKTIRFQRTDSPIEEILYDKLHEYELFPVSQYSVFPFFLDLAFPEIKLAIEADGYAYHSSKEQQQRDRYREDKLKRLGWMFERFTGWFLKRHGDVAAAKIALRYFKEKLMKEQELKATGKIVNFFMSREPDYSLAIVNSFLSQKAESLVVEKSAQEQEGGKIQA